ncbi:1,4-dihydroxy-6-naphthoate synthase [Paenibacillus sp. DYY-L-2]|uniref:1,4-dihydroxy-6-naphthoate synthase n=1 Tax=Paenibacillus sp. DYY-L-2 TaxID=3447013 RepID=UPI003F4F78C1
MKAQYDLFTKIFLDTDREKSSVVETVSMIVQGSVTGTPIVTEQSEIFVFNNEDFSEEKRNQDGDDFLYYRYYIDIGPVGDVEEKVYIGEIAKLLIELWDSGFKVVAACDFEDELPRRGGYNFRGR